MTNTDAMQQNRTYQSPYILALDVGTSSTRALLFDATGATIPNVVSQHTYQLTTSNDGEVSVDVDMLVGVVAQTIDESLKAAGALAQHIGAVAMDTFWHGLIAVDASGNPITPLITWEDTRAYHSALALREQLDERVVHDRTGARFHASYWPAKLHWLATQQPEIFSRAAQWLSFGEYLQRKFLGRSICSLSMASGTGMLVTHKHVWDHELMDVLHVKPEQFPSLGDSHDSVQGLTAEYASRWPALRSVPWFPAFGDGATACIGSGCASIDNWSLTIGTSSAMRVVIPPAQVVPPAGLWFYLVDARRGVLGGALSEGGNLLAWLRKMVNVQSLQDADPLIAKLPPDGHGLTILPFIAGERSLGWHAEARMTVHGISLHTVPEQLLCAGVEALAYQLYEVYEQLHTALASQMGEKTPKLICSGGALLNSALLQGILADTLDVSLYPSRDTEASARGAALLALEALGYIPDVAQVLPDVGAAVQPNRERGFLYRKAAARQKKLYQKLIGN